MQALDRIMSIIEILAKDSNQWFTKTDISESTELPISTIHRLLDAMEAHHMVTYDPHRKMFQLGHIWLKYGLKAYDSINYISYIRTDLEELMKKIHASVYLLKPLEKQSIIIERIDSINQTIATHHKLGTTLPLSVGAANLSMLAFMPEEIISDIMENELESNQKESLKKSIQDIRENKYIMMDDYNNQQITNIASPIINSFGNVLGAINVRFEKQQLTEQSEKEMIDHILFTANKISWKLKNNEYIV